MSAKGRHRSNLQHGIQSWFQAQTVLDVQERLQQTDTRPGPACRYHRRHRGAAARHRVRHRVRSHAGGRHPDGHRGRLHHFLLRRQQGADRRPDRRLHRHRLRNHPAIRHERSRDRDLHGRCIPDPDGRAPSWHDHQVYPLPDRRGLHQRYRPDDLRDPDQGPLRAADRKRPGRIPGQMGRLFPAFRHRELVDAPDWRVQHPGHRVHAQDQPPHPGLARGHHPDDGRRAHPQSTGRPSPAWPSRRW